MMKILVACSLLICTCLPAHSGETTFNDILSRVSQRDPITKAILSVDKHLRFRLEIKGDQAEVTIWKHMKIRDPNQEKYTFPVSDAIRQEHARLACQTELNDLKTRCEESECRFRVSQYTKYPVRYGMSYQEAKKLLKDEFKPDGVPRAEKGAYRLESDTHSIVFRQGVLVNIVTKETSNKPDAGDGK